MYSHPWGAIDMQIKKKWSDYLLGIVLVVIGFGAYLNETADLSSRGIHLVGTRAKVIGLVLVAFGVSIVYFGLRGQKKP